MIQDDKRTDIKSPAGEGTNRDTIKTGTGTQKVKQEHGVSNPYAPQSTPDNDKDTAQQRVDSVADAIKRDQVTINPDTGRPINMPAQTDGYKENLNNPYSTEGKNFGALEVDEVQELRDAAVKAEMNGHPAGAAELREKADLLEQANKQVEKDNKKEGVTRK